MVGKTKDIIKWLPRLENIIKPIEEYDRRTLLACIVGYILGFASVEKAVACCNDECMRSCNFNEVEFRTLGKAVQDYFTFE